MPSAQVKETALYHYTIIIIEHSLENLIPLADRMVLLVNGEMALEDATLPFFEKMDVLLERRLFPPGALRFFYELIRRGEYHGRLPLSVDEAAAALQGLLANRSA